MSCSACSGSKSGSLLSVTEVSSASASVSSASFRVSVIVSSGSAASDM